MRLVARHDKQAGTQKGLGLLAVSTPVDQNAWSKAARSSSVAPPV